MAAPEFEIPSAALCDPNGTPQEKRAISSAPPISVGIMSSEVRIVYSPIPRARDAANRRSRFRYQDRCAWNHQDGRGLTLQLDLVPAEGSRIVLRTRRSEEAAN